MSDVIDWSKAPGGATHWSPPYGRFVGLWARVDGDQWFYHEPGASKWHAGLNPRAGEQYVERPQTPWSGEGLPPVGTVCECGTVGAADPVPINQWREGDKIKCVAHIEIKGTSPLPLFWNERTFNASTLASHCFRPIRTTEQISADEREEFARTLMLEMGKDPRDNPNSMNQARKMYDLGYRKQ